MLFRKSANPEPQPQPAPAAGKGRATPTRKEAQAARQRPLVINDRKLAKEKAKQQRQEAYALQQQAMVTGDERYLPLRDRGPARRFARDYVDARWSIAELFMPLAFLVVLVMLTAARYPQIALGATVVMYAMIFAGITDALAMVWFLRKRLAERFQPGEIPPWTGSYAFQRSFMLRRFRMPKPQVRRNEWPHRPKKPAPAAKDAPKG